MGTGKRQRIVVVGHGMVGHRFAQAAVERGLTETHDVLVLGEEPREAYDRVALTSWFGRGSEALSLLPGGAYDDPRVRLVLDSVVTEVDREARTVTVHELGQAPAVFDDSMTLEADEILPGFSLPVEQSFAIESAPERD